MKFWCLLLLPALAIAEDSTRFSSVRLGGDLGTQNYASTKLEATVGVSPSLQILANGYYEQMIDPFYEEQAGFDYLLKDTFSIKALVVATQEPSEIRSGGVLGRVSLFLSPLTLLIDLGVSRYTFPGYDDLMQTLLGIGFLYELSESWAVGANANVFLHSEAPTTVARIPLRDRLRTASTSSNSSSLTQSSVSARLLWIPSENFDFELAASTSRAFLTNDRRTSGTFVGTWHATEQWSLSGNANASRLAGEDALVFGGLDVEFLW